MKIDETIKKIEKNIPVGVKKIAIEGALIAGLMAGCGRTVDNTPVTTPAPTTTIEHQVDNNDVVDNPEVDIPVVDDGQNAGPTTSAGGDSALDNPTFVLTGENEYTVYVDCADNSNAPELDVLLADDTMHTFPGSAESYGVSENLINAVLTHGMQVDPNNMLQINYDAYADQVFEIDVRYAGRFDCVITNDGSAYDENVMLVYTPEKLSGNDAGAAIDNIQLCAILLKKSIENTNGNITCALMSYRDPNAWNQAMEECMNATGLTAAQIYAGYDAAYVMSFDTLGLGDPDYVNGVLQYIGNEPITVTEIDSEGINGETTTYIVDRAKAYGQYSQR